MCHILDIRSDAFAKFSNVHTLFLSVNHHKTGAMSTNESPLEPGQVPEPQSTLAMMNSPTSEHALDETIELPPSPILETIEADVCHVI